MGPATSIYFIGWACAMRFQLCYVDCKFVPVSAVAQTWLILGQAGGVIRSVFQILSGLVSDWRDWTDCNSLVASVMKKSSG